MRPPVRAGPAFSGSIAATEPRYRGRDLGHTAGRNRRGSPTEDGGGVVAAQTWQVDSVGQPGVYLLDAATGAIIEQIVTPENNLFGQAVFANNSLPIGAGPTAGLTAYQITSWTPYSVVDPSTIPIGATTRVTLTGSGFTGEA